MSRGTSVTHERVAAAWRFGRSAFSNSMETNGRAAFTYGHQLGYTDEQGRKVAFCCHASQSSAVHSGILQHEADDVVECEKHGRPDLHYAYMDSQKVFIQRQASRIDYGPESTCETFYGTATACWQANPDATCIFRCLRCDLWHPSREARDRNTRRGPDPRHPSCGYHEDTVDHQNRYECQSCGARVSLSVARRLAMATRELSDEQRAGYVTALQLRPWRPESVLRHDQYRFVKVPGDGWGKISVPVVCPACDKLGQGVAGMTQKRPGSIAGPPVKSRESCCEDQETDGFCASCRIG